METDKDMELRIFDLSKGLAEVVLNIGGPVVQFIHQSVEDFLLETGLQSLDYSSAGSVAGRGHLWLWMSCIKVLSLEEVQVFDDYSAESWICHAVKVENAKMPFDDLAAFTSELADGELNSWFCVYQDHGTTFLHTASEYNLIGFVDLILSRNICWTDRMDGSSRTALSIAAGKGHEEIVKSLITRDDVDINSKNSNESTPLYVAAEAGHETVVQLLSSQKDVEMNLKNRFGNTPLSIAAEAGHETVVKLLITRDDIDVNLKNHHGDTPLSLAAGKGRSAVTKLLITRDDVCVNSRNWKGHTPFLRAVRYGYSATVALLLEEDIGLSPESSQLPEALVLASANGQYEVVELLLQ